MAVDLALVADVLPDNASVAKDLVLAAGGGSYAVLSVVAGACVLASAGAMRWLCWARSSTSRRLAAHWWLALG
jgi:hypothetical protein